MNDAQLLDYIICTRVHDGPMPLPELKTFGYKMLKREEVITVYRKYLVNHQAFAGPVLNV